MTKLATSYLAPQFIASAPQMFQIPSESGREVFGVVTPLPTLQPSPLGIGMTIGGLVLVVGFGMTRRCVTPSAAGYAAHLNERRASHTSAPAECACLVTGK